MNINKTARLTGLLYFIQMPLAIFGVLYVPMAMIATDALTTMNNFTASASVFRMSIGAALVVQVSHLFIAMLLYKILSPVNRTAGVYMVLLMAVSVPLAMLNELLNFAILHLADGTPLLAGFSTEQISSLVVLLHTLHEDGIFIAQIFWGLWLIPMGILIIQSEFLPKWLGYANLLVATSYMLDLVAGIFAPQLGLAITETVGFLEILFPFWLLVFGVNVAKWEAKAQVSRSTIL